MPPLTRLDKGIYTAVALIGIAAYFGALLWTMYAWEGYIFREEAVLAVSRHMSQFWASPALFSLMFTGFGLWCAWYGERRPIFGIKGFLYGPPLPKIYPLFMKDKPPKREKDKTFGRMAAALIIGVNLVCLAFVPLSIPGRDVWMDNGHVVEYNMFGKQVEDYSVGDAERITVRLYFSSGGRHSTRGWKISIKLVMGDGTGYSFGPGSFRNAETEEVRRWILDLSGLLERYPSGVVTFEGAENLENLLESWELNETEARILREIFGADTSVSAHFLPIFHI